MARSTAPNRTVSVYYTIPAWMNLKAVKERAEERGITEAKARKELLKEEEKG